MKMQYGDLPQRELNNYAKEMYLLDVQLTTTYQIE